MAEKSLREQLKPTSTKVLKKLVSEEDSQMPSNSNSDFLQYDEGTNKFRILPALPGEPAYYRMRCIHWLTIIGDDGKEKRATVQNAIIHGGQKQDIIEEYIDFVKANLDSTDADESEKIKALTAWDGGLGRQASWICYAYKVKEGNKKFGLMDMKKTIRDQMNRETIVEDEEEALDFDPFTDPDDGIPVIVTLKKEKKGKTTKTSYSVKLSKNALPLTDDEVEEYCKKKPLSQLNIMMYSKDDFEKSLEGLRFFDEKHEIGLFDTDEFQEIVESLQLKLNKTLKKTVTSSDDSDDSPAKTSTKKTFKKVVEDEDEDDEEEEEVPKKVVKKIVSKKAVEEEDDSEEEEEEAPKKAVKKIIPKKVVEEEDDEEAEEEEEEEEEEPKKIVKKVLPKKVVEEEEDDEEDEEPKKKMTKEEIRAKIQAKMGKK